VDTGGWIPDTGFVYPYAGIKHNNPLSFVIKNRQMNKLHFYSLSVTISKN
jgi:hypothetical protein